MSAVIIANTRAGSFKKKTPLYLKNISSKYNISLFLTETPKQGEEALTDAAREKARTIIIIGGDGTLISLITLMISKKTFSNLPDILLIKGGTTNMVHLDVGHPLKDLEGVLEKLQNNTLTKESRNVLRIHPSNSDIDHYGFFFAIGAIPRAIQAVKKTYHKVGLTGRLGEFFAALSIIMRLLAGGVKNHPILQPKTIGFSFDGESWNKKTVIFSFASTLQKMILGIHPPQKPEHFFWASLIWPYKRLLPEIKTFKRGKKPEGQAIKTDLYNTPMFIKGPEQWVLDGEIFPLPEKAILKIDSDTKISFLV